jgi:prepilin-type N-terminal cleavage/methylation domain-containing protein
MKNSSYKFSTGRKHGWTLTEILIVVVIAGILGSLSMPIFVKVIEKAKVGEAIATLSQIRIGQKLYLLQYNQYWTSLDDLNIENPNNQSPRYFNYSITSANATGFTATATRGVGTGVIFAPAGYNGSVYTATENGTITGPLI